MKRTIIFSIIISQLLFYICLPVFLQLFIYLHPIVMIFVWICMTALVIFLTFLIRNQTLAIPNWLLNLLMVGYSICLLVLLFFRPNDQVYDNWNWIPFSTIGFYLAGNATPLVAFYNLAANIVLFIPFGLIPMMAGKSNAMRFLIPLVFISLIEFCQFITQRGSLDIDDLILNMLGVFVGYMLIPIFRRVVIIRN
ncbi:VanZ family protein [Oceanobacillus arenosus]|uniref:VanZ family protein n=1 Tax=Oceanobacillus arenosus TaxID=1229153 RepID=A0A3D8PK32_9BACI|nr:VanZ family protein [Oceanobacillus arenosus]RDW16426.1 VanZ family protein [Oceanobacillus arenosus]